MAYSNKKPRKKSKESIGKRILRFLKRKWKIISATVVVLIIIILAGTRLWFFYVAHLPKFCYVSSAKFVCTSEKGNIHAVYDLPTPNGRTLTDLVASPDQKHYVAISSNVTGLTQKVPAVWLFDRKLKVEKSINLGLSSADYFDRIFPVWSQDSKYVLLKSASGSDSVDLYSIDTGKLIPLDTQWAVSANLSQVACNFIGYYGFTSNDNIIMTCGDQPTGLAIISPEGKILNTEPIDGVYAGSIAPTKDGVIIYHNGNQLFAVNDNGSDPRKLAAQAEFSYFKYDRSSDTVFLINKTQSSQGYTTGVKSVSYISVGDLLNGKQPNTTVLNSNIHAEDTPNISPLSSTKIVLSGLNGSAIYDLATGKSVKLSPSPLVVPGDVSPNLEGISGLLHQTNYFHLNIFHQKLTLDDKVLNLNKAPASFQSYLKGKLGSMNNKCAKDVGRYGSQLNLSVVGANGSTVALATSCQVTGYWGAGANINLYASNNNKDWQQIKADEGYYWPLCSTVNQYHISNKIIPTCDTGGAVYVKNANP